MKRVALYVRVSTQEQKIHGISVDAQIDALLEYAKKKGLLVVDIYNDAGISARKRYTKRPALLRLLDDCKQGKVDMILFTKLDRWFRSVGDFYEVQRILDETNVTWQAIWENYSTTSAEDRLKTNIMLSIAQDEADRTSERTKKIFEHKRAKGEFVGYPSMGFVIKDGHLVHDEKTKDCIEAIFRTFLATASVPKTREVAGKFGLVTHNQRIREILKNPSYSGETRNGYKCPPYITKEEQEKVLAMLENTTRTPNDIHRVYIFSGLVKCGYCGSPMSFHTSHNTRKDGTRTAAHYCFCKRNTLNQLGHPHVQIVESKIERFLLNELDNIFDDMIVDVKRQNDAIDKSDAMKKKKALEARLKRLSVLFEDGDMDADTYRAKRDAIRSEISSIRIEPIKEPKPLPPYWRDIYDSLDDQHKQQFWRSTIKSIVVTRDTKSHPKVTLL